jgi:hypothetical protein
MPMLTMTAAEIAAAEAAAIAAAEAAAVHAAQVAAAQAAQAAAAEAAATAAAQATTQAATQATTSGIQTLAQEVATTTPPAGIETLNMGQVPVTGTTPTGIETLNMAQPPITGPTIPSNLSSVPLDTLNPAQLEEVNRLATGANELASPMSGPEFLNQSFAGPAVNTSFIPPSPPAPTLYGSTPPLGPQPALPSMGPNTFTDIISQANANAVPTGYELNNSLGVDSTTGTGIKAPLDKTATYNLTGSGTQSAAKPGMVEEFMNMSLPNKLLTGMMGATGYEMLNKPKPYEKEKYKSTFKPGLYTGYTPVQPTPYQPRYAVGGIADLGGYSDGGRMLKGPGDGMSDDIPATIANKQPARLANEEFVVPADVVSHLGNGSSEAGAKVLYKMMERVRKARTGNKKQGKQINPEKYLA